ncbi:LysR family transcriptional regulator [Pseudomonas eucalypticola]|uniref:LysR family transcriptional regulator n=2 Tax=Pseudomonas TaxID=286 RepID=A0A7D5H1F7_9PSED|nr:LysR family transcriptional regulator [Pseudomonas eucalypticola]QKZ05405.1 LysR family transcriptional regulator [Pseudomonas eucalypticola]
MRGSEFAELKAFVAIAEHGSFTRAAAYLGMSASALSQTLKALEMRVGARLFNRTTRSVALTETGAQLLARLQPTFEALEAAVAEAGAKPGTVTGRLRINSTRDAALHCLAPLVAPFLQCHPGIKLEIEVDDRLVDIVAQGYDAGVRLGERLEQDMIAVKLGGELQMMVVAAPAYLQRCTMPLTPQDLRQHACLGYRRPTDGSPYRWEFERDGKVLEVKVDGPILVSDPAMLTRVVLDGAGLAYLFAHQVQAYVEQGLLVQVLPDWTPPFAGFYLYYPSRSMSAPLRAWVDFLRLRAP